MPAGRPTIYTQGLADEICERLTAGESLRRICNGPPNYDPLVDEDNHSHMPALSTVLRWATNRDHEFCSQYEDARKAGAEGDADYIRYLADNCDGMTQTQINKARLQIDVRKWTASKLLSPRYGDRVTAEVTDPGGHAIGSGAAQQLATILATAIGRKPEDDSDDGDEALA